MKQLKKYQPLVDPLTESIAGAIDDIPRVELESSTYLLTLIPINNSLLHLILQISPEM